MIVSKTPLRLSFFGGGTDIPSFYRDNDFGAVVSASLDSYLYVSVKSHTTAFDERIRLNYYETELVDDISQIKNTIIREALNLLGIDERIFIGTISDGPPEAGLGSSSSFAVGLLNALYYFKGIRVSQGRLAEEAAHIEIDLLKKPIGKQDQYAAAYGGFNYFQFNSDDSVSIEPINLSSNDCKLMFDSIVPFWTKVSRSADSILEEQETKNKEEVTNLKNLIKMRQQAVDFNSYIKHEGFNLEKFGKLVHEGWLMKKSLASKISNKEIDSSYEAALREGAIGGKISGAGGGGFLNMIAEPKYHKKIIKTLTKFGLIHFNYGLDTDGSRVFKL